MIRVIVIDGVEQDIYYRQGMVPSHAMMEELIGTRFWIMRRLGSISRNCVLFHAEGSVRGYEDFSFLDASYMGIGMVCSVDAYGDLGSASLSIDDVAKHVNFLNHVKT